MFEHVKLKKDILGWCS